MWNRRKTGQRAEKIVAQSLIQAGYSILAQNWSCSRGELDIIARYQRTTVFVEVRAHTTSYLDGAEVTVTQQKQRRVCAAAELWLQHDGNDADDIRFDVVAVQFPKVGAPVLEHFEDAFTSPWAV